MWSVLVVSPQPILSSSRPLQCIKCVEQVRVSVRAFAALHTGYLLDNVMVTDAEKMHSSRSTSLV